MRNFFPVSHSVRFSALLSRLMFLGDEKSGKSCENYHAHHEQLLSLVKIRDFFNVVDFVAAFSYLFACRNIHHCGFAKVLKTHEIDVWHKLSGFTFSRK